MKCLSCGFELDDDAVFCSQCGKKIELPAETLTEDIKSADDAVSDVKGRLLRLSLRLLKPWKWLPTRRRK